MAFIFGNERKSMTHAVNDISNPPARFGCAQRGDLSSMTECIKAAVCRITSELAA